MNYTFVSSSAEDTLNFGKKIAAQLHKKDVFVLTGELGSGKTKLVEGILSFFNLQDEISSPTFTIVMNMLLLIFLFFILMFIAFQILLNFMKLVVKNILKMAFALLNGVN